MPTSAVLEIAGADSLAAALRYCATRDVDVLYVTQGLVPTEYGDEEFIASNVEWLTEALGSRCGTRVESLWLLADDDLWRAMSGRFVSVIAERYGAWTPCPTCHMHLHMLRVPFAREIGASTIVSGERERHDARTKPNQNPSALDAYIDVIASAGIELAMPLRDVVDGSEVQAILGDGWVGGSPQLDCVFSGNYRGLDGGCELAGMPDGYFDDFLVPAGKALIGAMPGTFGEYEEIVAETLRAAGR